MSGTRVVQFEVFFSWDHVLDERRGARNTTHRPEGICGKGTLGIRSVAPDHWSRFTLIRTGGGTLVQLYSHRYGAKLYLSRRDGHKVRLKGTGFLAGSV